jgi:hypothetical protein
MGDGQHVWAAAEWVMAMRNIFLREEEEQNTLILCSGIPEEWLKQDRNISFGPSLTSFGRIKVFLSSGGAKATVKIAADWLGQKPRIEVRLPGYPVSEMSGEPLEAEINLKDRT